MLHDSTRGRYPGLTREGNTCGQHPRSIPAVNTRGQQLNMKLLEDAGPGLNCSSVPNKSLRFAVAFQPCIFLRQLYFSAICNLQLSIRWPHCAKDLCINERRAYVVTLPINATIAVALS